MLIIHHLNEKCKSLRACLVSFYVRIFEKIFCRTRKKVQAKNLPKRRAEKDAEQALKIYFLNCFEIKTITGKIIAETGQIIQLLPQSLVIKL